MSAHATARSTPPLPSPAVSGLSRDSRFWRSPRFSCRNGESAALQIPRWPSEVATLPAGRPVTLTTPLTCASVGGTILSVVTDLVEIRRLGEEKEEENLEFRRYLKAHPHADRLFHQVAQ